MLKIFLELPLSAARLPSKAQPETPMCHKLHFPRMYIMRLPLRAQPETPLCSVCCTPLERKARDSPLIAFPTNK